MFEVNDEPEGIFLYTETIKLYCIVSTENLVLVKVACLTLLTPAQIKQVV